MIIDHGKVPVAYPLLRAADSIKHQNYKTNTPKRFQTQPLHGVAAIELMCDLSALICEPYERLDFVYFSVCKGAEPHVDLLDPAVFEPRTYVVPLILPKGVSTLVAQGARVQAELFHVYEFNHEEVHALELEDTESGCVVVMVTVKR